MYGYVSLQGRLVPLKINTEPRNEGLVQISFLFQEVMLLNVNSQVPILKKNPGCNHNLPISI